MTRNIILLLVILIEIAWIRCESFNINVLMPNVSPKTKDLYLCTKHKLQGENTIHITEFRPNSTKDIAHHILLFACETPGSNNEVWNCGEMNSKGEQVHQQYETSSVCKGSALSIIYAWAMDAPKLVLPKDVAFKVGPGTQYPYIIMQVHYANIDKFLNGGTDDSGIVLVAQNEPVENTAGVYLVTTGGYIAPQKKEYFEAACEITDNVEMIPFAYRSHAHQLGILNTGYVVKTDPVSHEQKWIEIGRRSPQLPQMFYPATNEEPIRKGDVVAARCTMYNFQDHKVFIGMTGQDEMCNFYIMYYVRGNNLPKNSYCFSIGPPFWHLQNFQKTDGSHLDLSKLPEDVSEVPEEQQKELAEKKDHGMMMMHNMNANQANSDMSDMSKMKEMMNVGDKIVNDGHMMSDNRMPMNHDDNIKMTLFEPKFSSSEELQNSDEQQDLTKDSYENYLEDLEARYILSKLARKYF